MQSIVLQLQAEALDRKTPITNLLRKAQVVARKLKISELQECIESEFNGYKRKKIPDYRKLHGRIVGWNPYRGWIPMMFHDPKYAKMLSSRDCGQPISEIQNLIENAGDKDL